jgi:hypothetical protein
MPAHSLTTLAAGQKTIAAPAIAALASQLRGRILDASDAAYEDARAIWNGMVDRRPGLIIRCADADDVVSAIRFVGDTTGCSSRFEAADMASPETPSAMAAS